MSQFTTGDFAQNMKPSLDRLIQFCRWFFVCVSVAFCAWMILSMGHSIGRHPLGWSTPLVGILLLALIAPFGMIAYFGIRGDYRRLFTTVIFVICFVILVSTTLGLSRFHFPDLIKHRMPPGLSQAFSGGILSSLQFIAPFIPAVLIFRILMRFLLKIRFPTDKILS